jgi:hypothetical protein
MARRRGFPCTCPLVQHRGRAEVVDLLQSYDFCDITGAIELVAKVTALAIESRMRILMMYLCERLQMLDFETAYIY